MASCPNCKLEIPDTSKTCEHCGQALTSLLAPERQAWLYGRVATVALACGQIFSLLAAAYAISMVFALLFQRHWGQSLQMLFSGVILFAFCIVFGRAQRMGNV